MAHPAHRLRRAGGWQRGAMARGGALWLLVDGHNLIHADDTLRSVRGGAEEARRALEARLAPLAGGGRLVLFYDGGPGGVAATALRDGIELRYAGAPGARGGGEADDAIVAWLRDHAGRRAAVVSDDRILRGRSRALGATLVGCDELLRRVPLRRSDAPDAGPLSAAEVDEWMRLFGITEDDAR